MRKLKLTCLFYSMLLCRALRTQQGTVKQSPAVQIRSQSSALIPNSGEEISTTAFHSKAYWFPVKVPSTVLTGLVANHIYPEPVPGV